MYRRISHPHSFQRAQSRLEVRVDGAELTDALADLRVQRPVAAAPAPAGNPRIVEQAGDAARAVPFPGERVEDADLRGDRVVHRIAVEDRQQEIGLLQRLVRRLEVKAIGRSGLGRRLPPAFVRYEHLMTALAQRSGGVGKVFSGIWRGSNASEDDSHIQ